MPLPAVISLLLLMGSAVAWGFAGPPAARQRPLVTILLLGAGLVSLPVGLAATVIRHPVAAMLIIATGVCLLGVAAHLLRAPMPPPPRDDGADGPQCAPDPPPDWGAFDREREVWARERAGVR